MLWELGTQVTQTVINRRTCKKFQCCCLYTGTQRFTFTCEKKKKHPFKSKPKITSNIYHKLKQGISTKKKKKRKQKNRPSNGRSVFVRTFSHFSLLLLSQLIMMTRAGFEPAGKEFKFGALHHSPKLHFYLYYSNVMISQSIIGLQAEQIPANEATHLIIA